MMKKPFTSLISLGWGVLLILMIVAHLMEKSLVPFQPVLVVWLVLTIIHWRRQANAQSQPAVAVKPREPKR